MTNPAADPAHPDLAWHLRRLLETVKGAARGLEGRWGWLGAPLVWLTWLRTRRERREAAEAIAAFQGLVEAFLGLLEDFRAGRLAETAPEANNAGPDKAPAYYPSPQLWSASRPKPSRGEGGEAFGRPGRAAGPSLQVKPEGEPARKGRGIQSGADGAEAQSIPAGTGVTVTVSRAGKTRTLLRSDRAPRACFHFAGLTQPMRPFSKMGVRLAGKSAS